MNGESPIIYGDGTQTRDFTYIDDVVSANLALLETDTADGEAVNVGSTDNIEIRELAGAIRDEIDSELEFKFDDRHAADAEHTHASVSRARDRLNYEPTYDIREGVTQFIDWYRDNRGWYEPLIRAS